MVACPLQHGKLFLQDIVALEVEDWVGMGRGDEQERQQQDKEARQHQKNVIL